MRGKRRQNNNDLSNSIILLINGYFKQKFKWINFK
jgi:hypothetical protein